MHKPSEAQIQANRNNAKHSHGPNSHNGKHRSSQNALRHGLTGRIVVLPTEDLEAYKKFSKELVDSLRPESPMETQFAQTIADTQWRLNRARTFEDGMLALGHFEAAGNFHADSPEIHSALTAAKVFRENSQNFANLSLYEQRLSRAHKEAFRQLRELQSERKAELQAAMDAAIEAERKAAIEAELRAANQAAIPIPTPKTKPLTQTATAAPTSIPLTTSEPIGFVYSTPEIKPAEPFHPSQTERKAA
jgi:hypothetical protein